jgi:hypothetical protein
MIQAMIIVGLNTALQMLLVPSIKSLLVMTFRWENVSRHLEGSIHISFDCLISCSGHLLTKITKLHNNKRSLLLDLLDDEYEGATFLLNVGNNSSKDTASVTAYQSTRPNIYEESVVFNNSRCITVAFRLCLKCDDTLRKQISSFGETDESI